MSNILVLCDTVRQTSLAIHQYFRSGHLEKVYENTLAHRLRNKAIDVKQQMPIDIYDEDGTLVGHNSFHENPLGKLGGSIDNEVSTLRIRRWRPQRE